MAGLSRRRLLAPRSVAVVGASASAAKAGHQLVAALADFGGPVLPINPKAPEVLGRRCYPSICPSPTARLATTAGGCVHLRLAAAASVTLIPTRRANAGPSSDSRTVRAPS